MIQNEDLQLCWWLLVNVSLMSIGRKTSDYRVSSQAVMLEAALRLLK
jgi:hypothetical protein